MPLHLLRTAAIAVSLLVLAAPSVTHAQSGNEPQGGRPGQGDKPPQKVDEFAEAARVLGGPASNAECVWLGRRVVSLLTRDDLDTAYRHLDLYDRFGCPGGHIQASFRCVVRLGAIDLKATETLNARVHQCWINPALQPAPAATPPSSPGDNNKPAGTNQQ